LAGQLALYIRFALDLHKPFVELMSVLLKLREKKAPGLIEPNMVD